MSKRRPSASSTAAQARLDQQNALQRLKTWDGKITPEAARQGQADRDAWESANAVPVPTVFPVNDL